MRRSVVEAVPKPFVGIGVGGVGTKAQRKRLVQPVDDSCFAVAPSIEVSHKALCILHPQ